MKTSLSPTQSLFVIAAITVIAMMGNLFAAAKDVIADVDAKKQTLSKMNAEIVNKPAPAEPESAKKFLENQQVPLSTEAELRKKRAALLAKNTMLKRKEFQKGARIRALARDPSLSQLPEYNKKNASELAPKEETPPPAGS